MKIGDAVYYTNPYHNFTDKCIIQEFKESDDGLTQRAMIFGEYTRVITDLTNLKPVDNSHCNREG